MAGCDTVTSNEITQHSRKGSVTYGFTSWAIWASDWWTVTSCGVVLFCFAADWLMPGVEMCKHTYIYSAKKINK